VTTYCQCNTDDRPTLGRLYRDFNGSSWINSLNWLTSADMSEWYGVTVNADGRVTSLVMPRNNMIGSFYNSAHSAAKVFVIN
jgi:hypothetical protein